VHAAPVVADLQHREVTVLVEADPAVPDVGAAHEVAEPLLDDQQ
jgi:hypothetical protein